MACLAAAVSSAAPATTGVPAPTLSVLYFENHSRSQDLDWLSSGLADMLASDIAASGAARVVERERLAAVLEEEELQLSGALSDEGAVEVGRMLAAQRIVLGSFALAGTTLRLDARIVDAGSAQVLGAASAEGSAEDPLALERRLASSLLAVLGAKVAGAPDSGGTSVAAAAAAYYRGLEALDSGTYGEARARFLEAAALDPAYAKPQASLEDAYRILKDFRRQRQQHEMAAIAASLQRLRSRVDGGFYRFADMVQRPGDFGFADAQAASAAYQADPRGYSGDSPVQALWNMQMLLLEMAQRAQDYGAAGALAGSCYSEVESIAARAGRDYPDDPFLKECLYAGLLPLMLSGRWADLKAACEAFMAAYPDYRLAQAVEDMYGASLGGLSGAKE